MRSETEIHSTTPTKNTWFDETRGVAYIVDKEKLWHNAAWKG